MNNTTLRQLKLHRDNYKEEYEKGGGNDTILEEIIEDIEKEIERVEKLAESDD